METVAILLRAPTFWRETAVLAGLATVSAIVLVTWSWNLRCSVFKLRLLVTDERGAAEASDFALTFPFVLLIALCMVQFAMAANASLIVHYAAYAAARAARAHTWERAPIYILAKQRLRRSNEAQANVDAAAEWLTLEATNASDACRRAYDAARLTLIAATPSTTTGSYSAPTGNGCNGSDAWPAVAAHMRRIGAVADVSPEVLMQKARYAFSPDNTTVDVKIRDIDRTRGGLAAANGSFDSLPITATVTYRYVLVLPVGRLFGRRGSDGLVGRNLTATMRVL